MGNAQERFDPIWRRIKADEYTSKLEGPFEMLEIVSVS